MGLATALMRSLRHASVGKSGLRMMRSGVPSNNSTKPRPSIMDLIVRDGKRQSVFRSYTFPLMDRPNLTVLTHALVTRITFEGNRATGVEISHAGKTFRVRAGLEVVLSLGAIN